MRLVACLLLILTVLFPLYFVSIVVDCVGTTVFLTSDTVWTRAQSPVRLESDLVVARGITLTIEPGVIVNLLDNRLFVNGTLIAKGNPSRIIFTGGIDQGKNNSLYPHGPPFPLIEFEHGAGEWNEQTGSGSIIENATVDIMLVAHVSIKVDDSRIKDLIEVEGNSSIISNSQCGRLNVNKYVNNGSALISGNEIGELSVGAGTPTITYNNITGTANAAGSPFFAGNKFSGGLTIYLGHATVTNNEFTSSGITVYGDATISNNKILNVNNESTDAQFNPWTDTFTFPRYGIKVNPGTSAVITENQINGFQVGLEILQPTSSQIYSNAISNNFIGIWFVDQYYPLDYPNPPTTFNLTVHQNTITNNTVGLGFLSHRYPSYITNNEIYGNTEYNLRLFNCPDNLTITYNNWGTTNATAISQSIYDSKNNPTLGTVTFSPFNTQLPIPEQTASPSPLPSTTNASSTLLDTQTMQLILAATAGTAIVVVLVIVLARRIRK